MMHWQAKQLELEEILSVLKKAQLKANKQGGSVGVSIDLALVDESAKEVKIIEIIHPRRD